MPGKAANEAAGAAPRPWHVRARLKPLPGWITIEDAAEILGISRVAVHRLIERRTIKRAHTLGRNPDKRPLVVVSEKEILALPVSPQRKRELRRKGLLPDEPGPELGEVLPEG